MPASPRKASVPIEGHFLDRWSPRAFSSEPLPEKDILRLFEAARWAPSSSNGQPWMFLYAYKAADLKLFQSLLNESNQEWANRAPLLVFALGEKHFAYNGKPNRHYAFDTGAAWMSLALQAHAMGLRAHAMAGIQLDKSYEALKVPREKYDILCAIAVGKQADASTLSEKNQQREKPSERKPLSEVAYSGEFPAGRR